MLLALLFALPIFGVAYYQYSEVSAAEHRLNTEREGVRFEAEAVRLLQRVATLPLGRPADRAARADVDALFRELDESARTFADVVSEAEVIQPVRRSWEPLRRAVTPESLEAFEGSLQHSATLISDGSNLSFEANVVEGDVQDAVFDVYPHMLRWLTLADAIAADPDRSGRVPVEKRIALAGSLAQATVAQGSLSIDMEGAFGADASLRERIEPLWLTSLNNSRAVSRRIEDAMNGRPIGRRPGPHVHRDQLVRDSSVLTDALEAELQTRLQRRLVEADRKHVVIVIFGLLAALLSLGIIAGIARAVARRDRRELERVRQEAQMLTTELARQHAERALQLTEAQFRAVFDRSHMGIALLDALGGTIECNAAVSDLLGPEGRIVEPGDAEFSRLVLGGGTTYVFEREVRKPDGAVRWAEVNVSVVAVSAAPSNVVAIAMVRDVTERKAVDDRLRYAATHDQVTSLPNRTEFVRYLEELMALRPAGAGNYAVLFIDLDDFKVANDRFGHHAGDRLLVVTARRLLSLSGPNDLVARFHGDEFAVLLGSVRDAAEALATAQHVQDVLRAPVQIDGNAVSVTSSVGVVLGNNAYVRAEDLVRNADAAMYHAKSLGRGAAVVFDDALQHRLALRMRLITDLQAGLGRGEFHLAYQPVVDLRTGEPDGLEALMRWRHPASGAIPPGTFIPLAEESGAIIELGRFALREACTMLAREGSSPDGARLTMNVNLSVTQLMEPEIVDDVADALVVSGLAPERLMLEITESALLEDGPRAAAVLGRLKALGVRLCIDDFGTGYSSLRYLHKFPIDALKIDRSFVCGPNGDIANEPIVQMVVTLGHSLEMEVIAEGIETETQRRKLMALGCKTGQGFLFARPIEALPELRPWLGMPRLAKSG